MDKRSSFRGGVLVVVTTLAACATSEFQGDGKLVDHGPFAAKDRYVLDLGPVDMGRPGKYTYTMARLPETDFVVGLEIVETEPNQFTPNPPAHSGRIRVLLETSAREVVIREDSSLKSWKRSFTKGRFESFLYRVGEEHWITNKDGTTSPVADGVRTDEGWGTFFRPRPDMSYQLTLEVVETQDQPRPTRLLLKGGGWK